MTSKYTENNQTQLDLLFDIFKEKRISYYRELMHNKDSLMLSQISKIPDNWNENPSDINITDEHKRRLHDIKRYKSWELRLEIFFMYYLVDIENYFLKILNYRAVEQHEIEEAVDSANSILCEIESNLIDFRYLLLSIAKRSISDLYYLLAAYQKFYNGKAFDFMADFQPLIEEVAGIFDKNRKNAGMIKLVKDTGNRIDKYFSKSSNFSGWRLDETALKQAEKNLDENSGIISELVKILPAAYSMKNKMKKDHDFLGFYYNKDTGRIYRFNLIRESFQKKVETGVMTKHVFEKFDEMKNSFIAIKQQYDMNSFENFGYADLNYGQIVEFIYKGCKVVEYYYLRNSLYENLQKLRNDILIYIDNEYHKILNIKAR